MCQLFLARNASDMAPPSLPPARMNAQCPLVSLHIVPTRSVVVRILSCDRFNMTHFFQYSGIELVDVLLSSGHKLFASLKGRREWSIRLQDAEMEDGDDSVEPAAVVGRRVDVTMGSVRFGGSGRPVPSVLTAARGAGSLAQVGRSLLGDADVAVACPLSSFRLPSASHASCS